MTPLDLINKAFTSIGAKASGEAVDTSAANDAFDTLNDMIDQWSTQSMLVFAQHEVIHELTPNQFVYTIGTGGAVGATFTGSIAGNVLTVTAIAAGALSVGQAIIGGATGTVITSLGTGLGGNGVSALGTYGVNISQTVVSGSLVSNAVRPLRINAALVRVVNSASGTLDYPVAVLNIGTYQRIGIKTLPGPWPRAVYYQPTEPVGVLNYWPNPSQATEMHLFCDAVMNRFQSLNDTITLPPGTALAMRYGLAELLMPEYPATAAAQEIRAMVPQFAAQGRAHLKRVNMAPAQVCTFDDLPMTRRGNDAGFIMHGGFL